MEVWMRVMVETALLILEDVREGWARCGVAFRGAGDRVERRRVAWFHEDPDLPPEGAQPGH